MNVNTKIKKITSVATRSRNDIQYDWLDNPDVQKLLDVISEIIANEYIQIAKQNKDVFSNGGGK